MLEEVIITQTVKLIQECRVIRKQYLQKSKTFLNTYVGSSDFFLSSYEGYPSSTRWRSALPAQTQENPLREGKTVHNVLGWYVSSC